jgi:hypothetical protein
MKNMKDLGLDQVATASVQIVDTGSSTREVRLAVALSVLAATLL